MENIDQYIQTFPADIQKILQKIHKVIHKAAPEATECISYQMPTFQLHGNLVHFAAYKNHIGLYPTPSGITRFEKRIAKYKYAKGSLRFPLNEPIPYDLITDVVKFRVKENTEKAASRKSKKPGKATTSASGNEVAAFLKKLNHPLSKEIESLRKLIKSADKTLTEHIKWNAPSFCHNGDDRITFNFPPKKESVLLIFHRGAKSKKLPARLLIQDSSGLLEWKANDRALVKFSSQAEINKHKTTLKRIINEWIIKASV